MFLIIVRFQKVKHVTFPKSKALERSQDAHEDYTINKEEIVTLGYI